MDSGRKHSSLPQTLIADISHRATEPQSRRDRGAGRQKGRAGAFSFRLFMFVSLCLCVSVAKPYRNPQAQEPPKREISLTESIRLSTDLVVIDAQAIERKTGRIVNGLKAADFELYEDGVRQEITHF